MMFTALPWLRILLVATLAASLAGSIWLLGANHVRSQWDLADAKDDTNAAVLRALKAQRTVEVITRYVDRVKIVRDVAQHNEKETTAHVTPEADAACILPVGYVRLHDAAAAGRAITPAGPSDAAPSGIALSTASATIAVNYGRFHENAEQIIGLQDWIDANCSPAIAP